MKSIFFFIIKKKKFLLTFLRKFLPCLLVLLFFAPSFWLKQQQQQKRDHRHWMSHEWMLYWERVRENNFSFLYTYLHNQFWIIWLYSNSILSSWIKNYFNKFRLLFLLLCISMACKNIGTWWKEIDELFCVGQFSELHLVIELIKYWREWDDKRNKWFLTFHGWHTI